ncbi:MAG TPA: mechanosensitive ion channel family protein [Pseudomonadales bacterium]|nr:mechanosensitive ion channel family protein [Pseudomonadales bacterium]
MTAQARLRWLPAAWLLLHLVSGAHAATRAPADPEAPLQVGNRTIVVFRAPLGAITPEERATAARARIERAFDAEGEGWTSISPSEFGILVALDDTPLFSIVPGDADASSGETVDSVANRASRALQKSWGEAREQRDPRALLAAVGRSALASVLLVVVLLGLWYLTRRLRTLLTRRIALRLARTGTSRVGYRVTSMALGFTSSSLTLLSWILSLSALFSYLTFVLGEFVYTRPASETLSASFSLLLINGVDASASALPGLFIAIIIFLATWVVTRLSTEFFDNVAEGHVELGILNENTAPATRRITNAAIWLFALAMAFPYLPGSHTEAFRGLSVILGLMVSIGASGLIGQVASGLILVYTRALLIGEYVRIQDSEGTVTELGLFVIRLRTGLGEEITLPNTLALSSITHNYSRARPGGGQMLEASVTIGYDTPWRQVHDLLLAAANSLPTVQRDPEPRVVQTGLSDFYVAYRLVACVDAETPTQRAPANSDLLAAIQDHFNEAGVQIMSPHYTADPQVAKLARPEPATRPAEDGP